ncbi:MAG: MFS transporter [Pseudomonadota bacterium]
MSEAPKALDETRSPSEEFTKPLNQPQETSYGKYSSVFMLQVAHDLPAALTATMAPTLFVKQLGLDLSLIGVFFLPFVVTALKWTWAPVVDNRYSAKIGRRKSWLAPLTFLVAASFLAVSLVEPSLENLSMIICLFVVKQIFFATQEIAADAYVVEALSPSERGIGSSIVWIGKEFGQIIGFAGLVTVADKLGWQSAFSAAAVLFILCNLPVLLRPERPQNPPSSNDRANLKQFFQRRVNLHVIAVVFAIAFAVQMPVAIIGPFLGDKGFTLSQIAVILGVSASIGALISLSIASQVIKRLGAKRTAIAMLFVAPAASPGFFWLAIQDSATLSAVIGIILWATICTAPLRMVLYAARIGWTSKHQAGTDITAQQSVWFLGYAAAGACAGIIASTLGWVGFFVVNVALTCAAMIFFIRSHDPIQNEVQRLYA